MNASPSGRNLRVLSLFAQSPPLDSAYWNLLNQDHFVCAVASSVLVVFPIAVRWVEVQNTLGIGYCLPHCFSPRLFTSTTAGRPF